MSDFPHLDEQGRARMVDVGDKPTTERVATASAVIRMQADTVEQIRAMELAKGDVLNTARIAGILAAKRTSELIPLCHQIPLDEVRLDFAFEGRSSLRIESLVRCTGRTGVEMEALIAVTHAALTVYDMCKSVDREMTIAQIRLESKEGGRSGRFERSQES